MSRMEKIVDKNTQVQVGLFAVSGIIFFLVGLIWFHATDQTNMKRDIIELRRDVDELKGLVE